MYEAAAPLLQGHPVVLAVGQTLMIVVAVASFYWAYTVTKPVTKRDARDLRQDRAEGMLGAKFVCNPGRRSTDRCTACPLDDSCLKKLPPLSEAEAHRDAAAVARASGIVEAHHAEAKADVVFVDDNDALGLVVEVLLRDAGVNVRLAKGFGDAVPFAPHERLLITDWRLQDGTGGEVIRTYRETDFRRAVMVVSALENPPADVPSSIRWVAKPFDPDYFVSEVLALLKKS